MRYRVKHDISLKARDCGPSVLKRFMLCDVIYACTLWLICSVSDIFFITIESYFSFINTVFYNNVN